MTDLFAYFGLLFYFSFPYPHTNRVIGVIAAERSEKKYVLQCVAELFECEETTESWDDAEPRVSRVVFIGRNLVRSKLEAALRGCVLE